MLADHYLTRLNVTQLSFPRRPYTTQHNVTQSLYLFFLSLSLSQACVDVRASPVFWQKMELNNQLHEEVTMPEWISTHPSHRNRITYLDNLIPEVTPTLVHRIIHSFSVPITHFIKCKEILSRFNLI